MRHATVLLVLVWALLPSMAHAAPVTEADLAELKRVATEMSRLSTFFGRVSAAVDDDEIDRNYRALDDATEAFRRLATPGFVAAALDSARSAFMMLDYPVPAVLAYAVADADGRRDPHLTSTLAFKLSAVFLSAATTMDADARFGPIADDPDFYAALRPPSGPESFLRNVKWVIDRDAMLRADFYTAPSMKRFLDLDVVAMRNAVGTPFIEAQNQPAALLYPFCSFRFFGPAAQGALAAYFSIRCERNWPSMPSFADVERVFGKKWKDARKGARWEPNGPAPAPAARAEHGNLTMVYSFDFGRIARRLSKASPLR